MNARMATQGAQHHHHHHHGAAHQPAPSQAQQHTGGGGGGGAGTGPAFHPHHNAHQVLTFFAFLQTNPHYLAKWHDEQGGHFRLVSQVGQLGSC